MGLFKGQNVLITAVLVATLVKLPVYSSDVYDFPNTNPAFTFEVFSPKDKPVDGIKSTFEFKARDINSLDSAATYWANVLKRNSKSDVPKFGVFSYNEYNADALSDNVKVKGDYYTKTSVNALYNGLQTVTPKAQYQGAIRIGLGILDLASGWGYSSELTAINHNTLPDLTSILRHEIAHSLGITDGIGIEDIFPKNMLVWNKYLRVENDGIVIKPVADMKIEVSDPSKTYDEKGNTVFNIAKDAPYFVGPNTMKVLGAEAVAQGLTHYQDSYKDAFGNYVKVSGLPILGIEDGHSDLSHIELRNSLMSHQDFRNWSTFMEAELAVLKDIGYDIDLRKHFGKSYYANNITEVNNDGYSERNKLGTDYTGDYSTTPFGIGLHIYGDNNNISQNADILSKGIASVGARIEGVENTFNVTNGTKIHANGDNSIGILTSWGNGHEITIDNGGEVKALGRNGIGASFDFCKNVMGEELAHRGSYVAWGLENDSRLTNLDVPSDLDGALVKNFNVNGKLEGKAASIYIDDTAYVENININQGAEIKGDIISKWNSVSSGANATVQNPTGSLLTTNLNFNDYDKTFSDNIVAKDTMVLNVKSGTLKYDKGIAELYQVNNASGSTLTGSARYDVKDTFNNNGVYNSTNGAGISATSISNEGTMNLKDDFYLDANVENGFLGEMNLGYDDTAANLKVSKNVSSVSGMLNVNNNSTIDLRNGSAKDLTFSDVNFNSDANLSIDLDLKTQSADRLAFEDEDSLRMNNHTLNITGVNVVNQDTILTGTTYKTPLISKDLNNQNLNLAYNLNSKEFISTPIFRYGLGFEDNQLVLATPYTGGSSNYKNFNPSVLSGSVGAQVGSYLTQINSYEQAFYELDMLSYLPSSVRKSMKDRNKYAQVNAPFQFSPNQLPEHNRGGWFRPYSSFENVGLHNGPKVGNVSYGSYFGGDSGIIEAKHNWDMMYSAYAGYNGSHQTYDGVGIYQNGGQLGGSFYAYKNKFWTALTANVGANIAEASTMYGHDTFTMLATGVASKTGYNFEFKDGRIILQPSFLMSYSFVNTFDFTNSAGVRIDSKPLNAVQLTPGVKLIGNTKTGWQPYVGVQMVLNIIDKTRFSAENVSLPAMSVDPYVQYGIGFQKRWKDRFSGFAQAMIRNGGRNGLSLSAGFRWSIGK